MGTFDSKLALENFHKRVEASKLAGQIDNSRLHAGSPMHYYCKHCGTHTETLPELHFSAPKRVCDACKTLVDHGLI